jgi:hypothetical protein
VTLLAGAISNVVVLALNAIVCAVACISELAPVILVAGISATAATELSKSLPLTYATSNELPNSPGYNASNEPNVCNAVFALVVSEAVAVFAPLSARATQRAFAYER